MTTSRWYVLDGHEPREVDLLTGARAFEKQNRHVGSDYIGDAHVSTVFLGLDHGWGDGPPILFETMIFGGKYNQETLRYATWNEAEGNHKKIVAALNEGRDPR